MKKKNEEEAWWTLEYWVKKNILGISRIIPSFQDYFLFWSFCHFFDI